MNKYTRMNWENTPSTATPLTADNLNHMDEGIEQATDGAIALESEITTARGDSADLNTRFTADEASLEAVKSEITTARGSSKSLGARLDGIDSSVSTKADKSTVSQLSARMQTAEKALTGKANATDVGNALKSKEDNSNKVSSKTDITDSSVNYPSIKYLNDYYYNVNETYSSEETNELLGDKANINSVYPKTETDKLLGEKANLVNSSNIFDFDAWAKGLQSLTNPVYRGTLDKVDYTEKSFALTATEPRAYTNGWISSSLYPQSMRIAVKPNTKYLFSWLPSSTNCGAYVFLNGVNSDTTRFELRKGFGSFTTVEDTAYIMIRFDYDGTGFFKVSEIMITEKESIYLPNKVAEGVTEVANEFLAFEKTTQASLDSKYDSSNIELGTATLTPYSTQIDKIKSATCLYEKIGDIVIVNVAVIMNATSLGGISTIALLNMPFSNKSDVIVHDIGISKNGGMFRGSVNKSAWLQFTPLNKQAYNFVADEQVNFSLIYKI